MISWPKIEAMSALNRQLETAREQFEALAEKGDGASKAECERVAQAVIDLNAALLEFRDKNLWEFEQ